MISTPEIGLAVAMVVAVGTNAAIVTRWGTRLTGEVHAALKESQSVRERLKVHEEKTQHGPQPYVTTQLCDTMHAGQQRLTEERFDQIAKRLDRIELSLNTLTESQQQMLANMMELTRRATEELERASAARRG